MAQSNVVLDCIGVFDDHGTAFIGAWYCMAPMYTLKMFLHVFRPDTNPALRAHFFGVWFYWLLPMSTSLKTMYSAQRLGSEMSWTKVDPPRRPS